MISGAVNARLEPIVMLRIADQSGQLFDVPTLVDTGFTGFLTLPLRLIQSLGLTWVFRQRGILADGNAHVFDVYSAMIDWEGRTRTVPVEASENEPLLGMALLRDHQVRILVKPGGGVEIESVP